MQFETLCHALCLENFTLSFVVAIVVVDSMSSILTSTKDISFTLSFDNFLSFNKTTYCKLFFNLFIKYTMSVIMFRSDFMSYLHCPSLVELTYLHSLFINMNVVQFIYVITLRP